MYKGTILDFNLIKTHVAKTKKDYELSTDSFSFIYMVLQVRFGLDDFEVEDAIIDGSNDCGIDAIYIEENDTDRPRVHILQSKYYQSADKFDRSFEGAALDKMAKAISDLILTVPKTDSWLNNKLLNKLTDIRQLQNPIFNIIFVSNSFPPSPAAREKFTDYLEDVSNGQDFFATEYLHLSDISKLLAPEKTKIINSNIRLTGNYLTWDTGVARTIVGRISGVELAKLRQENGLELFDKNVRGYLSSTSNEVNKKIVATSASDEAYRFFFLNNGLTVVCSKYKYLPKQDSPEIEIEDLQIVNGGQTTNSIFESYKMGTLKDQVNVLIRIIETSDKELLEKITESTNTQTLVNARDLRSNDPIQKKIESFLNSKGYHYEARANKFKGKQNDKRIDAVKAAQAYYAFGLQKPADAKNKKRKLFGTLYQDIFNDALDIDAFLLAFLLYRYVYKYSMQRKNVYSFATYSEFHTVALLKQLGISDKQSFDQTTRVDELIEKILATTDKVVKEAISVQKERYSHRAFFIDPNVLGRIEELLVE